MTEPEQCVVDASVLVDLATQRRGWRTVADSLAGRPLHAPAHVDLEVVSALARLQRAEVVTAAAALVALERFVAAPLRRQDLAPLVAGAWRRIDELRVADALYVELATALDVQVLTSDARLARASARATYVG